MDFAKMEAAARAEFRRRAREVREGEYLVLVSDISLSGNFHYEIISTDEEGVDKLEDDMHYCIDDIVTRRINMDRVEMIKDIIGSDDKYIRLARAAGENWDGAEDLANEYMWRLEDILERKTDEELATWTDSDTRACSDIWMDETESAWFDR